METSRALIADQHRPGVVAVEDLELGDPGGEVTIAVVASGVNFKDAMAAETGNRIVRRDRLVLGVDLAGVVTDPGDSTFAVGQEVLAHGYGLGVDHDGGFTTVARVPAPWVVEMPAGLTARQAMILGTAGFTAYCSLVALEHHGLTPGSGPLLVTGASGGLGSVAVALATRAGYEVVASSGKAASHDYLTELGATAVIGRDEIADRPDRVLATPRWAGAIDCVGGTTLAAVLRSLRYGAAVAASGLTAGAELGTTVYPFITRSVALLGIDAVEMEPTTRQRHWQGLAARVGGDWLEQIVAETVGLEGLPAALTQVRTAQVTGRILVDPRA